MHWVRIQKNGKSLASLERVRWCSSFLCRLRGLSFRKHLDLEDSLVLVEAQDSKTATAIHMLFVFFSIAAIWIDSNGTVVDKKLAKPFRLMYLPQAPARFVLEGPPSLLGCFDIGDKIRFEPATR